MVCCQVEADVSNGSIWVIIDGSFWRHGTCWWLVDKSGITIQHHFFSIPDPQSPNPEPQCIATLSNGRNICGPHVNVKSIESECTFWHLSPSFHWPEVCIPVWGGPIAPNFHPPKNCQWVKSFSWDQGSPCPHSSKLLQWIHPLCYQTGRKLTVTLDQPRRECPSGHVSACLPGVSCTTLAQWCSLSPGEQFPNCHSQKLWCSWKTITSLGVLHNHLAAAAITTIQRYLPRIFCKKRLQTIDSRAEYVEKLFRSDNDHPIIWQEYVEGDIQNHPEVGRYKTVC